MQATGNNQGMQCNLQQQREYGEPHEGNGAVPWFVSSIVAGLLVSGVVYIVRAPINSMPPARGDARVLAELQTPPKVAGAAVDGAAVYTARCASCRSRRATRSSGALSVSARIVGSETSVVSMHRQLVRLANYLCASGSAVNLGRYTINGN